MICSEVLPLEYVDSIEWWDAKSSRVYLKGEQEPETTSRNYQVRIKARMG